LLRFDESGINAIIGYDDGIQPTFVYSKKFVYFVAGRVFLTGAITKLLTNSMLSRQHINLDAGCFRAYYTH